MVSCVIHKNTRTLNNFSGICNDPPLYCCIPSLLPPSSPLTSAGASCLLLVLAACPLMTQRMCISKNALKPPWVSQKTAGGYGSTPRWETWKWGALTTKKLFEQKFFLCDCVKGLIIRVLAMPYERRPGTTQENYTKVNVIGIWLCGLY